jgi:hypothetical protein
MSGGSGVRQLAQRRRDAKKFLLRAFASLREKNRNQKVTCGNSEAAYVAASVKPAGVEYKSCVAQRPLLLFISERKAAKLAS